LINRRDLTIVAKWTVWWIDPVN